MRFLGFISCYLLLMHSALSATKPLNIVTSIPPLYAITANLLDDADTLQLLFKANQSPHQTRLKPSMAKHIIAADLIIAIDSLCFEQTLNKIRHRKINGQWLELLDANSIIKYDNTDHAHEAEEGGEAHCHTDPHIWLDPQNAINIAQVITEKLSELKPSNAPAFQQRFAALKKRLIQLDQQIKTQLSGANKTTYVLYHNAFHYFEKRYKLSALDIVMPNPEIRPGLKSLRQTRHALNDGQAHCLFTEPQFSTQTLHSISRGLPVTLHTLDPLGIEIKLDKNHYFTLLLQLAEGFSACFRPD